MTVLEIEDLWVRIGTPRGMIEPVRGISLSISEGESVAIVGESGSGKTVTALSIMGLLPQSRTRIEAARLELCHQDVRNVTGAELRALRGRRVTMIFQDPMDSLNPVMKIGTQLAEAVRRGRGNSNREVAERVVSLLESVEVDSVRVARSYPHQLSGGMKQRVMIAMALACRPDLVIADEPTTALDVSTQAGILDLLKALSRETGTSMLLVTHDLGVVADIAERIIVMYAGTIVETGTTEELFEHPKHPYTKGLIDSVPTMSDQRGTEFPAIPGSAPDIRHIPTGCPFRPRCSRHTDHCAERPPLAPSLQDATLMSPTHLYACWHPIEERR